ncbi:MAG: amino acid adenylation domain-containing protein, partial [Acidobacteriota bacterium]
AVRYLIPYLRNSLQEQLPGYLVPSSFVVLDKLPLSPNGKIDRNALSLLEQERLTTETEYIAPHNPIEDIVAQICSKLLGLEQVGSNDNFFELGGHSLLATQLASRLRERFQIELPLRDIFEAPTVASLAKNIEVACRAKHGLSTVPLLPVSRDKHLPLSFAQQRLWFLDQLEPNSPTYNIPTAVRVNGVLDVIALEKSFNQIITRHEVLRTTFACVNDQPVQVIADTATILLSVVELTGLSEAQREQQAYRLAIDESEQPFNLSQGPLLRAMLLRMYEEEHILLFTMHHIVSDGWSTGIFIEEMSQLYQAFVNDQPCTLPALPIQYADFAHWQREWLQAEVLQAELSYWKNQLTDISPLQLPIDRPRRSMQSLQGAHQVVTLTENLTAAIRSLSREEDMTLFMTLLSVFYVLLYRYSGQCDISLGTPIANRNHIEIEKLIGFFVNTLVLRTKLSADESFKSLLQRVREVALAAYTHQDLPFEKLVEELQPERDLSRTPLFQVMFALQSPPELARDLTNLTFLPMEVEANTAKFDLTLSLIDSESGLLADLEYNIDLFDATTITRMLEHFQNLLVAITTNPTLPIADLPLLSAMERDQLLIGWNNTKLVYPQDLCIHQLFEAQVERTPQAIAVIFDNQQLTYLELNQRANQLAHHLQSLAVGAEKIVGIYLERSIEMMVAVLAVLKSGAAYLPLDPSYPYERLAFILNDTNISVLLTTRDLLSTLPQQQVSTVCLDQWNDFIDVPTTNPNAYVSSDNIAYVIYTSGSTGRPKGVMVRHCSLVNHSLAIASRYNLSNLDRLLQFASLSFDVAGEEIFPGWTVGAMVILRQQQTLDSLSNFLEFVSSQQISVLNLPASFWQELVNWLSETEQTLPSQLRLIVFGSEKALRESLWKWNNLNRAEISLHNAYGSTETTITTTIFESNADSVSAGLAVPIGQPIGNTQVYILDRRMHPVPIGIAGELHIGGNGLARGYLNRAELTAEKFIPNPFSTEPGSRLYRSGDLARFLPDGNIEFIGRIDN